MSKISDILDPVELPEIVKVRQIFEHRDLLNVYETLFQKLEERKLDIKPGQRIAITYPVCPSCYNRIPEEIFELPLIKIALAASKSGGKTCMALSWFRTLNDARGKGLNSHVSQMDFISMLQDHLGMEDDFGKCSRNLIGKISVRAVRINSLFHRFS